MNIKIEKMTFADLQNVAQLADQLGYPHKLAHIQSRFLKMENDPNYALFVSKDEAGKVTGYIQVNREPYTLLAIDRAEVSALVVDSNYRSQGVGTALLTFAERWAKENELSLMRVRSNINRKEAHKFYEKRKYDIKKSWHLFAKELS